jgi:hypothetical protein
MLPFFLLLLVGIVGWVVVLLWRRNERRRKRNGVEEEGRRGYGSINRLIDSVSVSTRERERAVCLSSELI